MNWLEEKPLISNAVSASVINGIGDVLAQVVECSNHMSAFGRDGSRDPYECEHKNCDEQAAENHWWDFH